MESHQLHPELLRRKVRVLVVGCGGNGSAIAAPLKQHVFNSADVCISCGADLPEADLPCDYPLQSAPDYFDLDDPRGQAEESEYALRSTTPDHEWRKHAGRSH